MRPSIPKEPDESYVRGRYMSYRHVGTAGRRVGRVVKCHACSVSQYDIGSIGQVLVRIPRDLR